MGLIPQEELILKDFVHRRRQLAEDIAKEKNRLEKAFQKSIRQDIEDHVAGLKTRLKKMEKAITKLISSIEELQEKAKIMASMPGIGITTAAVLLADLPELGKVNNKQIAALVGVAPMNKDSGQSQSYRKIAGGRLSVRCALYMAAVTAIRHNSLIKPFYQRLRGQGKPAKVALTAAMRKIIIILNQMAAHKNYWKEIREHKNLS